MHCLMTVWSCMGSWELLPSLLLPMKSLAIQGNPTLNKTKFIWVWKLGTSGKVHNQMYNNSLVMLGYLKGVLLLCVPDCKTSFPFCDNKVKLNWTISLKHKKMTYNYQQNVTKYYFVLCCRNIYLRLQLAPLAQLCKKSKKIRKSREF